jgi:hypothetical protein
MVVHATTGNGINEVKMMFKHSKRFWKSCLDLKKYNNKIKSR